MPLIRHNNNGIWFDKEVDDSMPTMTPAQIEDRFYQYLNEYSLEKYPSEHRHHLGISIIGEECWRKLWFGFRWVKLEQHIPRMRRLFQRGHREEAVFEAFLSWAGVNVRSINPETDKQYLISLVDGHYGGSTDGISLIGWCDDLPIICEYKTHNYDRFQELKKDGLQKAQPKHWAQMCGYGKDFKVKHGLYCAVCKDDDDVIFKFYELDWNYAISLEKKATDIIYARLPPTRISEQPAYYKCKFCNFQDQCHHGAPVEKNCRSCVSASPVSNGQWHCDKFNDVIPKEFLVKGCDQHKGIV